MDIEILCKWNGNLGLNGKKLSALKGRPFVLETFHLMLSTGGNKNFG